MRHPRDPQRDPRSDSLLGRAVRAERLEQMQRALELRREGKTYEEIGALVPTTVANGHGFLKKPRASRGKESVRRLLEEGLRHFYPNVVDRLLEMIRLGVSTKWARERLEDYVEGPISTVQE